MSRMGFRLMLAGGAIVFGLTVMAVEKINHAINYVPVEATITGIESRCFLKQIEEGVLSKTTRTTDTLLCSKAEALHASHPEYAGMNVEGTVAVAFDYTSPADQSAQSGQLSFAYADHPQLAELHKGADLPILASKNDPPKVAQDYDRLD